ncbi:MAG: DUF5678 domain-containing protein [Thermodesulfobacteriota bacterium]|jgi:hypothetical protein
MATPKVRTMRVLPEEPFAAEEQAFRQKRVRLLHRYEGRFVALYRGRVVGHGQDDEELARQMFEKFGDVPSYIAKVEKEPTLYELPSPEVVH